MGSIGNFLTCRMKANTSRYPAAPGLMHSDAGQGDPGCWIRRSPEASAAALAYVQAVWQAAFHVEPTMHASLPNAGHALAQGDHQRALEQIWHQTSDPVEEVEEVA